MTTISAALLALTLTAPQGPTASNYEKALVLKEVRRVGFLPPQILVLRDSAWSVRQANDVYDAQIERLDERDAELETLVQRLAAGAAVSDDLQARLDEATRARKDAFQAWDQRVTAAVTKVLATFSDEQKYMLGVPERTRQSIESTWQQVQSATGDQWDRLVRSLSSRLMRDQYNQLRQANGGSSDRGRGEDRRDRSRESRAMRDEMERQGRAYLSNVRNGNPTLVKSFKQLLAESYMRDGEIEANLRGLIRAVITAPGAPEALDDAVRAR
ncbi:MAG: hypothetical protein M9921_01325 [Fimbriimonadaceae bacterium]|nr:hypothetical protein [Fimbriimonadaceae bacterium]